MEGPNGRWKTEDGELTRIRRRAHGASSPECGSGCWAENLVARPRTWLLSRKSVCSGRGYVSSGRRTLPQRRFRRLGVVPSARWSIRPLRPRAGAFAARFVRSANRPPASAVRAPARTPGYSRRRRRRLQRNPSAGFRNRNAVSGVRSVRSALDSLAPELNSSSPELIRCLPNGSVASGVGFVGSGARCASEVRRNRAFRAELLKACRSGSSRPAIFGRCRPFAHPSRPLA
jgi:hypothetical protein